MNIDLILIIVFAILLLLFLIKKRKYIEIQKIVFPILYFVMYKTSFGIKSMNKISRFFPRTQKFIFSLGYVFGFLFMGLICYAIIKETINLFLKPEGVPGIMPVLPIEAKGVFYVPFSYLLICIIFIAFVHEFCHGIVSRLYNVRVKSSGFAFLGILLPIIPAAFVEPDEKSLVKKKWTQQLSIFAAGPFSNILCALIILLVLSFILTPIAVKFFKSEIKDLADNVQDKTQLNQYLFSHVGEFIKNPNYGITFKIFFWFYGLFYWLFVLNIGIGLFNLVPIGPVDGGRMFHTLVTRFLPQKTGEKVYGFVSFLFAFLIIYNVVFGFFK